MLVNVTSLPQVLFAKHWYCPLSALVILVMFSLLSCLITPPPIFDHVTNGSGGPIALQFKNTLSPSTTVLLSNWFTDAGTEKTKEKKEKKLKMIEQLQSYNAKYKVVKNTEITAFLLFSIFFFYFGKGNKGRVKEGNKAHAFSTMNFDILYI